MEIKTNEISNSIPQTNPEKVRKQKGGWKIFGIGLLLGAAAVSAFAYYRNPQIFAWRTQEEQTKIANQALVKDVSKIMILPANEEPTILDITDPQSLIAQQQFFTGAIAGDKLLVYPKNARAIVYSPSRRLIVNVGPVTTQQAASAQPPSQPVTPPLKK